MRIALVNNYFSERMGYADVCLARALSHLGHEVHVVASDGQPYFDLPGYAEAYQPFLGPPTVPVGTTEVEGFKVHRRPHQHIHGRIRIDGLVPTLRLLRPEIVQTFSTCSIPTTELALARPALGYRLFASCHIHESVFPPLRDGQSWRNKVKTFGYTRSIGRLVSAALERCYPISADAAVIATRFFGIDPAKVEVLPLAVDTDLFRPPVGAEDVATRARVRAALELGAEDVVAIYTGRFSKDKDPLCLARAIGRLRRAGGAYGAIFIGGGPQEAEIRAEPGCRTVPFVDFRELGGWYRAADVGVWPRQESTSQLDAMACGLPIIISDETHVPERVEGTGRTYAAGDPEDLARVLEELKDPGLRARLGAAGAARIQRDYSWRANARTRLDAYRAALAR